MDRYSGKAEVHRLKMGQDLATKLIREVLIFLLIISQSFHTATIIAPSIFPQFFLIEFIYSICHVSI